MKKFFKGLSVSLSLAITLVPTLVYGKTVDYSSYGTAKNVILMIPDGMSVEAATFARLVKGHEPLAIDEMTSGLVRTNNSNTPIADSAPAGTAMATGIKTQSPFVGSYPEKSGMANSITVDAEKKKMPISNVLEGAKRIGKSTGIIATSNIQHATPADFSAHHPNRNNYEAIGEQQVYQKIDVVLGAGDKYLRAENRVDGENLIDEIKNLGYDFVTSPEELKNSTADKLWGSFAPDALAYDLDRDPSKEPSLAEMTSKALDVLSKNEKGFFLMVEGSKIDWACHANDPVGLYSDVIAFDKAVEVAKSFADKNPGTVVIAASDHGTGGLSIGNRSISKGYDKEPLETFITLTKNAKLTGEGIQSKLDESKSNVKTVVKENIGIDLNDEETNLLKDSKDSQQAIGTIISNRSKLGWTTGGHQGGDVALYCYIPDKSVERLSGTVHNNEIAQYISGVFKLDLNKLTNELYVYVRDLYKDSGANISFDHNNGNPILRVEKDNTKLEFPTNKNYVLVNGEKQELDGLALFNGEKIFLPLSAKDLLK